MAGDRARRQKRKPRLKRGSLVGETVQLDLSDMAHGGLALGKLRGATIFVPYALPGESVTARITRQSGSTAFAKGLRLRAASDDRVEPRCPHFGPGRCWGCQWQHIDYAAQLLLKQDVLADQLSRIGKLPDALIDNVMRPVRPAQRQWAYSQQLTLQRDKHGAWGLPRRGKAGLEIIDECHLVHPDLLAAVDELDFDYDHARKLTLRRGSDGRIMLIAHIDAEEAPTLHTDLPLSVNLMLPNKEPVNLIGDAHSHYTIGGRDLRATAGAYMRHNIEELTPLVELAMSALALTGGEQVLDLYAGVGVFSAFMAGQAGLVSLVESYPPALNDADVNLAECDNIDLFEGSVEDVLGAMVRRKASCDAALVDPPGRGLSPAVIGHLAALNIKRLVYVSGEPASLARDCRALFKAGFSLSSLQPIDLAPQTYFISAVARFDKSRA